MTGEAVSCASSPPDEVLVARRAADGRALRRSRPIAGGRLVGFTRDGRFAARHERRDDVVPARRADVRAPAHVPRLRRGGALAGRGHGGVRPGRRQRRARRSAHGRAAADGAPGDRTRARARVQPRRQGARDDARTTAASRSGTYRRRACASGSSATPRPPLGPLFSPDGATLYTGSSDGSVIVWDVRGERRLGRPFRFDPVAAAGEGAHTPARNASTAVAVSPDGSLFATSPAPGRVTLWRSRDQAVLGELRGPFGYVVSLAFSHDGRLLAATGNAPNTVVWNVATRKIVRILRSPVSAGAAGVAFSPGRRPPRDRRRRRRRRARACCASTTCARAGSSGTCATHGHAPGSRLQPGRQAARQRPGSTAKILVWNVARRALERTIPHRVAILTIRFSPDGRTIATGDLSGNVDFWDAADGRRVGRTLGGQNGLVISVSYDPTRDRARHDELGREAPALGSRLGQARRLAAARAPTSGGWGTLLPGRDACDRGLRGRHRGRLERRPRRLGGPGVPRRAPQPDARRVARLPGRARAPPRVPVARLGRLNAAGGESGLGLARDEQRRLAPGRSGQADPQPAVPRAARARRDRRARRLGRVVGVPRARPRAPGRGVRGPAGRPRLRHARRGGGRCPGSRSPAS